MRDDRARTTPANATRSGPRNRPCQVVGFPSSPCLRACNANSLILFGTGRYCREIWRELPVFQRVRTGTAGTTRSKRFRERCFGSRTYKVRAVRKLSYTSFRYSTLMKHQKARQAVCTFRGVRSRQTFVVAGMQRPTLYRCLYQCAGALLTQWHRPL